MSRRAFLPSRRRARDVRRPASTRRLLFRRFGLFQIRFVRFELSLLVLRLKGVLKVESSARAEENERDDTRDAWGM